MRNDDRMDTKPLAGRSALITGASSGIGWATAKALVSAGAAVALSARRGDRLEALASELAAVGGRAVILPADLEDRPAVRGLVDQAVDALGGLDLLVNNAGAADWNHLGVLEGDLDQWLVEIEINLVAVMELTHAAARHMAESGGGDIVTISSMASNSRGPHFPGYQTSKAGATAFSEIARAALRKKGIRTTVVEPGEVDTPMQPEGDRAAMRMLDAADVAEAVVYAVTRPAHVCVPKLQIVSMPVASDG